MKIRKNDTVLVIAGKDKGKTGKVRFAYPEKAQIIVEGINFIKRHTRCLSIRQMLCCYVADVTTLPGLASVLWRMAGKFVFAADAPR